MKKRGYNKHNINHFKVMVLPLMITAIAIFVGNILTYVYNNIMIAFFISILAIVTFLWSQNKNIIMPIKRLEHGINKIDLSNNLSYRLPIHRKDVFYSISLAINAILNKTEELFHKIKDNEEALMSSNDEIMAAYEQLRASQIELETKYSEIEQYSQELETLKSHIEHMAYNDELTNLPNRRSFMEKLNSELESKKEGAIIFLDIDNFKAINDTLGHVHGDELLNRVAYRLKLLLGANAFISRFGGDEFLILISDIDKESVENLANSIHDIFDESFLLNNNKINVDFSMGITFYPKDSSDINQLIMNADTAMYQVKASGRNHFKFFDLEMIESIKEKVKIETKIREALKNDGFVLHYQPQIKVDALSIYGFEALLRFKNDTLSPAVFIPIAEESGLIIEVGRWVTNEAILQLYDWKERHINLKPISINLSTKQIMDKGYIEFLRAGLEKYAIPPEFIEIEITESILLEKTERTIEFLNELKQVGVKIALDDFGTGYSSLSYLTFIPVDKIKLDKSLSDKFLELTNIKVMDSLISLAHSLELEVIAEGIEDLEQYRRLRVGKCDYIQGYLFGKPIEINEADKIYDSNLSYVIA